MFAKKIIKWALFSWFLSLLLLLVTAGFFSIIYNGTLIFVGIIFLCLTLDHLFGEDEVSLDNKEESN